MSEFKGCKNYSIVATEELKDISTVAYTLVHDKTGARVVLLSNDDDNKAFMIGFKTPQDNSTGVPHILEHSVLGGSEKYPVKDAMTEVGKGSLNTFMNAFTYPDRTVYPVASCNDKDFNNLMCVYLDAVFFPRVLKDKRIFMQEGWHYEMESPDSELTINGVVYNEMKGVYSSPDSALSSYIQFSLFPDTQYGVESGGDPEVIPELTYEDFCAFHQKLYHPSNSRIFLYGKMNFEEKLRYIDEEYLSKFERIIPDSEVKLQKPFKKRVRVVKEYPITDGEETTDSTYLSYNVVCSDYTDAKTNEVMSAINYALCSVPGAKLKQRLLEAGIGKDVYSEFSNDICQKVFSIIAEDANPEDEERFVSIIEETMEEIIREGFDKKALEASITGSEFTYREADFGYYPKGVAYGVLTFEQWLYTDDNAFSNLKLNNMYGELRKGIDTGLFEETLRDNVLRNEHKSIVIMVPKKGLAKQKEDTLTAKLKAHRDTLSLEERTQIADTTKALKLYQETPDTEEALATIPTLSISDIRREYNNCIYSVNQVAGITEIYTDLDTNGIAYFSLAFNAEKLPERLLPALSIIKIMLGFMDTKNYSFGDLINECNIKSGGIAVTTSIYKDRHNTDIYTLNMEARSKAFYDFIPDVFSLIEEILFTSKLSDKKRFKENLEQTKLRIQSFMMQSGHAVAIGRAAASGSDTAALGEILSGMVQYRFIEDLLDDFDVKFDAVVADMEEVLSILLTKENLEVYIGAQKKGKQIFDKCLSEFVEKLSDKKNSDNKTHIKAVKGNEAFSCSSQVQYAAMCGNFVKMAGLPYTGSVQVLKSILNSDYLWTAVRLQGGAYGCFCSFAPNGDSMMVSYRDPNLKKTYDVYENAVKYVKEFPDDKELVERYIISTIGDFDSPLSPATRTTRSYNFYKTGITNELKQKERDEVLATTPEILRSLAPYVEAVLSAKLYSCVGGEDILSKEGKMFDTISPLYKA